jgi:DNA processing protein
MLLDPRLDIDPLWAIGVDVAHLGPAVGIVGTRRATPYGLDIAGRLARELASAGICVVSGLALGIDAAAHEGALRAGGVTVAVLGSGVDVPYPIDNAALYRRIATNGAILAEVPPGADPRKEHFPSRNRIIAGLSHVLVFVQGRAGRSGAFGTASRAHELDRDVMVVPGDVRAVMSSGPHAILKEGWGHPCTCAQDVLDMLGETLNWEKPRDDARAIPPTLPESQRLILTALDEGPGSAGVLASVAGLDARGTVLALANLELSGLVRRLPDGRYARAGT